MAAGVRPDTALAREAGLALNSRGAIVVDPSGRTSDPSIYAVGDAVQVYHALTGKPLQLPLAGPAQKQARQAADSICGRPVENTGYIGSSCIRVFDLNAASTGLTAAQCEGAGIPYDIAYVIPQDRVGLMPGSAPLHYKLVFQVPTGKVLGVQAISKGDAPKRVGHRRHADEVRGHGVRPAGPGAVLRPALLQPQRRREPGGPGGLQPAGGGLPPGAGPRGPGAGGSGGPASSTCGRRRSTPAPTSKPR